MPILDGLFEPQLGKYQKALTLTSERHSVLTNNLANLNTPGYKRKDVDFNVPMDDGPGLKSDRLKKWRQGFDSNGTTTSSGASVRVDGNSVDLEQEVFSIAETEMRYQIVSDMVNKYFSGLKNVIREGR